jgi:cell division cycle protein 37
MQHVAHQCIVMQFILELSKTLKYDPRACVSPFFSKMQVANNEYKEGFFDELNAFKERIRNRAREKIEVAMKEAEEEERQKRLGPGGLDPVEVFETLPESLQKCFESQNVDMLQETLLKMNKEDAEYHMDRCVKSGLWVPEANKANKSATDESAGSAAAAATTDVAEGETKEATTSAKSEEIYEKVD